MPSDKTKQILESRLFYRETTKTSINQYLLNPILIQTVTKNRKERTASNLFNDVSIILRAKSVKLVQRKKKFKSNIYKTFMEKNVKF